MLKTFLTGCSYLFGLSFIFYMMAVVQVVYHRKDYGLDTLSKVLHEISPLRLYWDWLKECDDPLTFPPAKMFLFILPALEILGLVYAILCFQCSEPKIGAFFEKDEYVQDYEATLQTESSKIFCIATVERTDGKYYITQIQFPYGHTRECFWDEYSEIKNRAEVYIETSDIQLYEISLGDMATATSYAYLETYIVSNSGKYCASRNSNKYHLETCPQVKNINSSNLIYFKSRQDAEVLGFYACDTCKYDG